MENACSAPVRAVLTTLLGIGLLVSACEDAGGAAAAPVPLTATSGASMVYTWAEPGGGFTSSNRLEDVPASARGRVMVVDLGPTAIADDESGAVLVADLSGVATGGSFDAHRVDRATFEAEAMAAAGPTPAVVMPSAGTGVTMYSASWCGVCSSARKFFNAKKVPFVEKDVEKDAGAAEELRAKTKAAGMAYRGGVPVIDIGGRLMVGFDAKQVENALKAAGILPG